jgi:hypothetical protein
MSKNKPYSNAPRKPVGMTPWDGNWDGAPILGQQRDWNKDAPTETQEQQNLKDAAVKKTPETKDSYGSRIKKAKNWSQYDTKKYQST